MTVPVLYPSYGDALRACPQGAYEADELVEVVVDKTALFNDALQMNRSLDLAAMRTLIGIGLAKQGSTLNVLDFGGAAGYHHSMARVAFGGQTAMRWNVVETEAMVRHASRLATDTLKFFDSLAAATADLGTVDLLLASSSLQYCPDPLGMLEALLSVGAKHVFITRTPFFDGDFTLVTTQTSALSANGPGRLPARYTDRPVSYPVTFLPRRRVEALLRQHHDIRFSVVEDAPTLFAGEQAVNPYRGYFCDRR